MSAHIINSNINYKLIYTIVLCSYLVLSCAVSNKSDSNSQTQSFEMSIAYYNDEGDSLGHMVSGEQILLLFPSIKGQIFGVPKRPILSEVTVSDNRSFEVELSRMNSTIATSLSVSAWTKGLTVLPAETKMLRAATMAFEKKTREPFAAGSLIDPESGDNLMLMYFDMPCTVTGSVQAEDVQYQHQITIKKAGWHWIAGTQPQSGISRLRALVKQPNKVEFAITVDGMLTL